HFYLDFLKLFASRLDVLNEVNQKVNTYCKKPSGHPVARDFESLFCLVCHNSFKKVMPRPPAGADNSGNRERACCLCEPFIFLRTFGSVSVSLSLALHSPRRLSFLGSLNLSNVRRVPSLFNLLLMSYTRLKLLNLNCVSISCTGTSIAIFLFRYIARRITAVQTSQYPLPPTL